MLSQQLLHWIEETFGEFGVGNFVQLSEKVAIKKNGEKSFRIAELEGAFQTNRYTDGAFIEKNVESWRQSFLSRFRDVVRKFHVEHSDIYFGSKDKTSKRVSFLLTISLFRKDEIKGE